jgi:hypothetical protein
MDRREKNNLRERFPKTVPCQQLTRVAAQNGSRQIALIKIVRPSGRRISMESLILAQDERWRRASYMQVERTPSGGNTGEVLAANG